MNEIFVLYSLIYAIVALCFVYKTDLFISVGLTVENLFDSYLGREQDNFIMYHIKRSCITAILHMSIPFGFFTGLDILKAQTYFLHFCGDGWWQIILLGSLAIPVYALFNLIFHYQHSWDTHQVIKKLKVFENETRASWIAVCNEINAEYKLLDKTILHCGNRMKLVLTRNWMVKVGTYDLDFAHQSDSKLIVHSADSYNGGNNGHAGVIQFINVRVLYDNERRAFHLRLYALDFKDLQEGVRCPVEVSKNVTFYQSKVDEFLHVFKRFVRSNPIYANNGEEREMCIGCMTTQANVKLMKNCIDDETENNADTEPLVPACISCRCRPLWCIDCMGKWFASRQNQSTTETWLSSKCPCPVCRSTFCLLDISPVSEAF